VGIDDPDAGLKGAYACNSEAKDTHDRNPQVEALLDQPSQEANSDKRKAIVWQIERILGEDVARPIIYHNRVSTCRPRASHGRRAPREAFSNNWRFEHIGLDKAR
jgi:peptide/nickel transport system substrate-binding protein